MHWKFCAKAKNHVKKQRTNAFGEKQKGRKTVEKTRVPQLSGSALSQDAEGPGFNPGWERKLFQNKPISNYKWNFAELFDMFECTEMQNFQRGIW